jgi:hypothetical protein
MSDKTNASTVTRISCVVVYTSYVSIKTTKVVESMQQVDSAMIC